jgi:hypothetical protein
MWQPLPHSSPFSHNPGATNTLPCDISEKELALQSKVGIKMVEGYKGQHIACSPKMVRQCYASPQLSEKSVSLTTA